MIVRTAPWALCLALSAPTVALAQSEQTEEGEVDLEAIDSLFADETVTSDEESGDAGSESETGDADDGSEEPAEDETPEEEAPEPSELTLAFNAYSNCAIEAGMQLDTEGFPRDVIGDEALLRCGGQRSAYVNAFYFSMLPRYPDASEAEVRASAERLVAQSDTALSALILEEIDGVRSPPQTDTDTEASQTAGTSTGAPLSLTPFRDEPAATEAMEFLQYCLETNPNSDCSDESNLLADALTDVFERKPELLAEGESASGAARAYVEETKRRARQGLEMPALQDTNSPSGETAEDETDNDA